MAARQGRDGVRLTPARRAVQQRGPAGRGDVQWCNDKRGEAKKRKYQSRLHRLGRGGATFTCERQQFICGPLKSTGMPAAALDPPAITSGPVSIVCFAAVAVVGGRTSKSRCRPYCGHSAQRTAPAPTTGVRGVADVAGFGDGPGPRAAACDCYPLRRTHASDPEPPLASGVQVRESRPSAFEVTCPGGKYCWSSLWPRPGAQ
jgi:hypothetical protein